VIIVISAVLGSTGGNGQLIVLALLAKAATAGLTLGE